jgi:hypothetical protein
MGYRDVRYAGFDKTLLNLKCHTDRCRLVGYDQGTNSWLAVIRLFV